MCLDPRPPVLRAVVRTLAGVIASAILAVPAAAQTLAGGEGHTLILKPDGTVWATGRNTHGQLGDGSNTQRTSPVQVSALSDVVAVAAGQYHSLAVTSTGALYCLIHRNPCRFSPGK